MINYGKNKNVLAGNFQKTIRFAACLLDTLEWVGLRKSDISYLK